MDNKFTNKVSILTPCWNGARFIQQYISMIEAQTYRPLEIIFVNDGSDDDTEKRVLSYQDELSEQEIELIYRKIPHQGQARAMNVALGLFTGSYFIYPDVDDILLPNSIEERVLYLDGHSEVGLVGSRGYDAFEDDLSHKFFRGGRQLEFVSNLFCATMEHEWTTFTTTYMMRREAFFDSLPMRKIYEHPDFTLQDVQMLLPIAYRYPCGFLDENLFLRIITKGSHSNSHPSSVRRLSQIDAIEDVFYHTILGMEIKDSDRVWALTRLHDWYGRLRRANMLFYGLEHQLFYWNDLIEPQLRDRKLIIWGTGDVSSRLVRLLSDDELPMCFLDNDTRKQETFFAGRPIYSPDFVSGRNAKFFVLVMVDNSESIELQLNKLNYKGNHDYMLWPNLWNVIMAGKGVEKMQRDRSSVLWENFLMHNIDEVKLERLRQRPVAIWGTGKNGKVFFELMRSLEIPVACWLDSDVRKREGLAEGLPVENPEVFLKSNPASIVVVAVGGETAGLCEKMQEKGYKQVFSELGYLSQAVNYLGGNILEIGPLNAPLFWNTELDVKFFDVMPADELRAKSVSWGLKPEGVPKQIDYVSLTGDLDVIDEKFSCVYSSHVIEHQPDLVTHFQKVERLLKVGGIYVLAISDKRYCFDYFSKESDIADVLTAYAEKRKFHTLDSLLAASYCTHNNPVQHWHGEHGERGMITRYIYNAIVERYHDAMKKGNYLDVHAWRFTPKNLRAILAELFQGGFIHLRIREIYATEQDTFTFFAVLEKV